MESLQLQDIQEPDNQQYLPRYEVGLVPRVDELKTLLVNEQRVAIVGFAGTGKTTLVKKLLNTIWEDYDYTCFLHSVKDKCTTSEDLRDGILDNLCRRGKKRSRADLNWSELKEKKVLFILDDVNSKNQLLYMEDFAKASHLIVTTRNSSFLRDFCIYKMELLDFVHSSNLFCLHAFGGKSSDKASINMLYPGNSQNEDQYRLVNSPDLASSRRMVSTMVVECGSLPLSLENVGSALYQQKYERWEEMVGKIGRLENVDGSDEDVTWSRLRSCYDVLGPEEKEMFLDMAMFSVCKLISPEMLKVKDTDWNVDTDWNTDYKKVRIADLKCYWKRIHKSPETAWEHLKARSLVQEAIGVYDVVYTDMHKHFLNLGRTIASPEDMNLSTHPRIFLYDGVMNDLGGDTKSRMKFQNGMKFLSNQIHLGEFNARVVVLEGFEEIEWKASDSEASEEEEWSVYGSDAGDESSTQQAQESLDLNVFSRFPNLSFLRLCALPLIGGHVDFPCNLATLHVMNCHCLSSVSFNAEMLVEFRLVFPKEISSHTLGLLSSLHSAASSSKLHKLRVLHIEFPPSSLESDEVHHIVELSECLDPKHLPALETFSVSGWNGVTQLPQSFANLKHLQIVRIVNCESLSELPSFSQFSFLRLLHIESCASLKSSPLASGLPASLKVLKISGCHSLAGGDLWGPVAPDSKLHQLTISSCDKISSLPDTFGQLGALENVILEKCSELSSLPGSFGELPALHRLEIKKCHKLETFPEFNGGGLSALTRLTLNDCSMFKQLPESFGRLSGLTFLNILRCRMLTSLSESFGELQALEGLDIKYCDKLETLPVNFGELSALKSLSIRYCSELSQLPENFGHLHKLEILDITKCNKLTSLPESFGQLSAVWVFVITDCPGLKQLPESLGHLSGLKTLQILDCNSLESFPKSFGPQLSALTLVDVQRCPKLQRLSDDFGLLPSLNRCTFADCDLRRLPKSFVQLAALELLMIDNCPCLEPLKDKLPMSKRTSYPRLWEWKKDGSPLGSCFSSLEDDGDLFES